jgi:hypothetical protein
MTFIPNALSKVESSNSSTTLLTASNSFLGALTATTGFNSIEVSINSNVASAVGGIVVSFYFTDGTTLLHQYTDTYFAGSYFLKSYPVCGAFFKITYINGSSNQASFNLVSRLLTTTYESQSNNVVVFDNSQEYKLDAFGKQRFTQPVTLLDIKFPSNTTSSSTNYKSNLLQIFSTSGGSGLITYSPSKCALSIAGAAGAGSYAYNQSRIFTTYQPGKSLLILCSGKIDPETTTALDSSTTCISRIGYFNMDTNVSTVNVVNGLYFQMSNTITDTGGVISINKTISVNYTSGSTPNSILQSSWNIDKMDGTGSSGISLDFTKCQLFVIDAEWLGVGKIRFGFYAYGKIVYCHQVTNVNALTSPYIVAINLPVSYYLGRTDGNGSGGITQICSTVISEGGFTPLGRPFSAGTGSSGITVTTGDETPIFFLKGGGSNYYHQNIIPSSVSLITDDSNDILLYNIYIFQAPNVPLNQSDGIVTVNWTSVNTAYSVSQYATSYSGSGVAPITVNATAGILVDSGFIQGKTSVAISKLDKVFNDQILHITANSNNVSDILMITCKRITSSNYVVYASVNWTEVY